MIPLIDDTVWIEELNSDRIKLGVMAINANDKDCDTLKDEIILSVNHMRWLKKRGFELKFCMFNCKPYLHNITEQDSHFETNCLGNSELTQTTKGNA